MKGGGSMKNFEVIKLNNSEYDYMVIATTCISPISTLTDIQNELEDKYSSKIVCFINHNILLRKKIFQVPF